ncbi:Derlin-1 [Citrus sinensis]|uniref:Derlin-1 n=1 Tax=Citrus sinensis TaxID=2711 RepID=A0ACB8NPX1_CITSI|nr:Derlin-1 [Citrus sinensis]
MSLNVNFKNYSTKCLINTNLFFIGIHFFIMAFAPRYGVQLEKSTFERRTADFLWMMIFSSYIIAGALSAIPMLWTPFLGVSLVFMLLYVWSRECFVSCHVVLSGLVDNIHVLLLFGSLAFYLPWAMLALDVIFGSPLLPNFLGIIAGHLYYFLTVLHPLAGGRNILATPRWIGTSNKCQCPTRKGSWGRFYRQELSAESILKSTIFSEELVVVLENLYLHHCLDAMNPEVKKRIIHRKLYII